MYDLDTWRSHPRTRQRAASVGPAVNIHIVVVCAGGSSDLFRHWQELLEAVVRDVGQLGAMVLRDHELEED